MFKVVVAGSREFNDYNFLKQKLNHLLQNVEDDIEIVSGAAYGADKLGERYAAEHGLKVKLFPADWSKGRGAGHARNREMAAYGDACVLFWMNNSKGTASMKKYAEEFNLKLRVYKI